MSRNTRGIVSEQNNSHRFLLRAQGAELRDNGINRIGNLLVPNDNYCKFEDWITPILDQMLVEQQEQVPPTFSFSDVT